jgi:hypothetical protein
MQLWGQALGEFLGTWVNEDDSSSQITVGLASGSGDPMVTYTNLTMVGSGSLPGVFQSSQQHVVVEDGGTPEFTLVADGTENGLKVLGLALATKYDCKEVERFIEEEGGGDPTDPEG